VTDTLATFGPRVYLQNTGAEPSTLSSTPHLAQISPIKGIAVDDVTVTVNLRSDRGGHLYEADAEHFPRRIAATACGLRGDGQGHFTPCRQREWLPGTAESTGLALIKTPQGRTCSSRTTAIPCMAFAIRAGEGPRYHP